MGFFKKLSPFNIFYKKQQRKTWRRIICFILVGVLLGVFFYLHLLLVPFKDFFWKLPSMLGFFGEKNYLVLVQNNSERRPTGGFITAYGEISFLFGFSDIKIKNSYDIDPPENFIEPPYPLNDLLSESIFYKGFQFRDGNWSPDFATSVRNLISIYDISNKEPSDFDGVFAVDITAIEEMLELVGQVEIEEDTLTSANLFHKSQVYSKNIDLHSVEELKNRKNIMKEFAPKLFKKLVRSPSLYAEMITKLETLLNNKHIQLFFYDQNLEKIAQDKNWAGEFLPRANDFVHVNVANIGGRKADRYIEPDYSYSIVFDEYGKGQANLDLNFHYNGTRGLYSDFYQAYIRVYIPKNIKNLRKWGDYKSDFKIEDDLNATSIGALVHIWPGETQSLHFSYELPSEVLAYGYSLQLMPMAGNFGEQWNVALNLSNVDKCWESESLEVRENLASFRDVIYTDTILTAEMGEDSTPPIIVWQRFLNNDLIELQFSEKLDPDTLKTDRFSLVDKNVNNKEVSDNPVILSVWQEDDYKVFLKLKGVNWQLEEHFALDIENISDNSGNFISPNPREITLVQR